MLTAYYSKGCDSEEMFAPLAIGKKNDFRKHLNRYDVIHIDIQWFLSNVNKLDHIVEYITVTRGCGMTDFPDIGFVVYIML